MTDLVIGNLGGANAGPLRWVINVETLKVWEWTSFVAPAWMTALLQALARRASSDFSASKVPACRGSTNSRNRMQAQRGGASDAVLVVCWRGRSKTGSNKLGFGKTRATSGVRGRQAVLP